jgi:hypothetical protein
LIGLLAITLPLLLAADADVADGEGTAPNALPPSAFAPAPRGASEARPPDLKDAKDGSGELIYDGRGFTAHVARDGSVRFTDRRITDGSPLGFLPMRVDMPVPSLQSSVKALLKGHSPPPATPSELDRGEAPPETQQLIPEVSRYHVDAREGCRICSTGFFELAVPVNWFGRFDVTDELTQFSGQDPYRQQKAVFLVATRDQRIRMAARAHAADIRQANAELPRRLQAVACADQLAYRERRAILVALASEMDTATPEGANAAKAIDAFVERFDSGEVACGPQAR